MIADVETPAEAPAEPTSPTEAEQDRAFYREVLLDITDAARDFARLLLHTAQHARCPEDVLRLAASFERASRCARRGILLARHLQKPLKADRPASPGARPADPEPTAEPTAEPERGAPEPRDRLDRPDRIEPATPDLTPDQAFEHAALQAPPAEAVATLKRDLAQIFEELSKPLYVPKTRPKPDD